MFSATLPEGTTVRQNGVSVGGTGALIQVLGIESAVHVFGAHDHFRSQFASFNKNRSNQTSYRFEFYHSMNQFYKDLL